MALSTALESFAEEVGGTDAGAVCVRGGATRWAVGGAPRADTREVRAPRGIVSYEPAEMTVQVIASRQHGGHGVGIRAHVVEA